MVKKGLIDSSMDEDELQNLINSEADLNETELESVKERDNQLIIMIIRWIHSLWHRNIFVNLMVKIWNELLASTYLSFILSNLAFSFAFLLSLDQILSDILWWFFLLSPPSVNFIQFRGDDIE